MPHQLTGARFLAERRAALLADEPRVGKTGAAIIAADMILAESILVVTTASGRGVWQAAFPQWSSFDRSISVMTPSTAGQALTDIVIVGWPSISDPKVRTALLRRRWSLLISDEDHYAKNFDTKRTQAMYGELSEDGGAISSTTALAGVAHRVWPLTGTPAPHSLADMYPRLRSLAPERLRAGHDVTRFTDFRDRYCIVRMKKISNFNRIPVIVGGRNEEELRERIQGFYLLRTQQDVGIRPPMPELLPLIVSAKMRQAADGELDKTRILDAAASGSTGELEMHLGPLRRLTGEIKARAVVDAVREEFEGGLDKIVLMYWHKDVGQILREGLAKFGVTGIDGSTPAKARDGAVEEFTTGKARVFLGQIVAAGEAIDLSAAAVLWFVESSFTPKDMLQASLRITNHNQKRQALVKVVTLAGSIDEALQARLMMLWATIRKVLK